MRVPSSNLFKMARKLIKTTPIEWLKFTGRTTNGIGQYVSEYDAPKTLQASVQSAEAALIAKLGLDIQPMYFMVYVGADVEEVSRDGSGDVFLYAGRRLQVLSENYWVIEDGWCGVLCVEIRGV